MAPLYTTIICVKRYLLIRMQSNYCRELSRGKRYISFYFTFHHDTALSVLLAGHLVCVELGNAKRELIKVDAEIGNLSGKKFPNIIGICAWFICHLGSFTLLWI